MNENFEEKKTTDLYLWNMQVDWSLPSCENRSCNLNENDLKINTELLNSSDKKY